MVTFAREHVARRLEVQSRRQEPRRISFTRRKLQQEIAGFEMRRCPIEGSLLLLYQATGPGLELGCFMP